jgi:uncharacterized protein (TIGR03437 family)
MTVLSGGSGPSASGQWSLDFPKADGYGSYSGGFGQVFNPSTKGDTCPAVADGNPAHQDQTFDMHYAAGGSVVKDPTAAAGALLMVYEGTNACISSAGGPVASTTNDYISLAIATSLDYGKTWPTYRGTSTFSFVPLPGFNQTQAPNAPMGALGPNVCMGNDCTSTPPASYGRYPVVTPTTSLASLMVAAQPLTAKYGEQEISGFVDDVAGNPKPYLYATSGNVRVARAQLNGGTAPLTFQKWNGQAFNSPGIGGAEASVLPTGPFQNCEAPVQNQYGSSISYVDDTQQYLLVFLCVSPSDPALGPQGGGAEGAAWFWSTSYDLSDQTQWTAPREIAGSWGQFDSSGGCPDYKGLYPSFMSLGKTAGHLSLTGYVFYLWGCQGSTPGGRQFSSRAFTITTGTAPPVLNSGSAANGATYIAGGLVPGSWAQVKGSNVATTTHIGWSDSDYTGLGNNLPTNLNGTTVQVNGIAAAVYAVSSGQVNFQVPAGVSGTASVQVFVNGTPSNIVTAATANNAPGIFPCAANGTYYPCGYFPDGKLVGDPAVAPIFRKAKPGDVIQMFGTGLAPSPAGVRVTQQPVGGVNVTIGTITVPADAAVLVYPGEFQVNFTVPQQFANMPAGNYPLTITVNGVQSPATINPDAPGPVVVPIQPPSPPPSAAVFYVAPNGNDSWSGTLPTPNAANNDGPFATFDRARAAVQSQNKTGLSQVTVQFRAGTYFLPSTENFTSADSGTPTLKILYQNYPGETPVISGGMRIQNWTNAGGNTWKATLPASTQYFENLFYNGVRRLRPRLGGYLGTYYRVASTVYLNAPGPPAAAPNPNCSVYIAGSGWECFDRFQYNPSDPIAGTWKNLAPAAGNPCGQPAGNPVLAGDIEVLDWEQFSTSKLRVSCIDTVNRIVYLTGPTAISQNNPQYGGFVTGNRYIVDNVQDALTQPGQWFLDHSTAPWTLTYLANPGENPNTDIVVAPQLPQVLVATGLQYVTFQGLTLEHDNYVVPPAGHKSSELEADISAAVSFQNSQYITFDSGTVTQISGAGLEFISCVNGASPAYCALNSANAATANDVIQNSAVYDTGALAIRIGDPYINADSDANVPQSMTVQNNVVEGYGRTIPASFGIGQGFGHDNLYTHNDVYDGYHCAISISESASDITKPNGIGNANNTISFNHVYDLLQGIMNDGGAIRIAAGNNAYTAPGNKILNNKIHDVSDASALDSNGYGGDGIYLDNQTGLVDVENNLVYRVSGNAVYTPQGPSLPNEANVIRNNILAYASQSMVAINYPYPFGVPPVTPEVFVVTGNLFYFDRSNTSSPKFFVQGGCLYAGGVAFPQFQQWNSNMYWRTDGSFANEPKAFAVQPNPGTGPNAPCSGNTSNWDFYTFAQWQQKVGEDTQSVVQNPGFANPAYPADDYSLPKGSPGVGFIVFDPSQAGRSNPVINPPAVTPSFPTKPFNPATDF